MKIESRVIRLQEKRIKSYFSELFESDTWTPPQVDSDTIYYKVKSKPEAEASLEAPLLRDAPFYFFLLLLPDSLLEQEAPVSLATPTQAVSLRATLTT